MRLKLTIFHSFTAFVVAYLVVFYDAFDFLLHHERTHVALIISAIYAAVSLYVFIRGDQSNWKLVHMQASMFPVLGICGTIAGLALVGFTANGDQTVLATLLVDHIGSLFIPTGFGVGFVFILGQQLALCCGVGE